MSHPNVNKTESAKKKPERAAKKTERKVKKTDRTLFKSKTRKIIANVYDFMKQEAVNKYAAKLTDARWRTAQAAGVSESTVTRILRERREQFARESAKTTVFKPPIKKRKVKPRKIDLEEIDVGLVRRIVQNYHNEYQQLPTLLRLKNILKERMKFDCCPNTLRKLLHKLGFKWRKTVSNGKVLMENHEIKMSRLQYLRQLKAYRNEGRPIVYMNESYYILPNKAWTEKDSDTGTKQTLAKGARVIIVHAGSVAGFIPNALLAFKAESKRGDYNDSINADYYLKWLEEKLIHSLPVNAVLVMGNASCHNSNLAKIPTSDVDISDMQSWLIAKNIPFEKNFKKVELYDLILKSKESFQRCKADDLLRSYGFSVLRLPVNHPDLNPTENIWGLAKQYIASRSNDQTITNVMQLITDSFGQITTDTWTLTCQNVEKIEDEYLRYFDSDISFMVKVCDTSESESDVSESNSD